jgi:hypothetical protein
MSRRHGNLLTYPKVSFERLVPAFGFRVIDSHSESVTQLSVRHQVEAFAGVYFKQSRSCLTVLGGA